MSVLSRRVVQFRRNRDWCQGDLASAMGCSQSVVSQLERGGPVSAEAAVRLHVVTGWPLDELWAPVRRLRKRAARRVEVLG